MLDGFRQSPLNLYTQQAICLREFFATITLYIGKHF